MIAAGAIISASFDFGDVEAGMLAMANPRVVREAMRLCRTALREDQKQHAQEQAGPEGAWPERSHRTIARASRRRRGRTATGRRRSHRRPGRLLGRLPTAMDVKATAAGISAESRVDWSLAQQEGATVGRGAILPARPFHWMSEEFLIVADRALLDGLDTAWAGGR